ncbi:alpha/beta fold hydrolase [uncultured Sphingomonas sp.]|uniref:alpha/beta fold hydrolase n=1 Tax=uncultured Sphingomonas sp. TaxID=158754 RepID=UPI0035CBDACE
MPSPPPPGSSVDDALLLHHAFADTNGTRLHYVTGGHGPAVVLLHGYPYTWEVWKPLLPLLVEAGYTVIAPDLRGLGFSDKAEGGYDKATVAADVRGIVRSLGFERIRLVGADIGAMVAYAYASRHPDEVERFVFAESLIPGFGLEALMNPADGGYWHFGFHMQVDVATMLTAGREAEYLLPWYAMMSADPAAADTATRRFLPFYQAPGGMRAGFRHYETLVEDGRANRAQFVGPLLMPTLVLSGERGIPQAQTLACVTQAAVDLEHDLVPGAGHTFASDNPEWTAARLIRFFDQEGEAA